MCAPWLRADKQVRPYIKYPVDFDLVLFVSSDDYPRISEKPGYDQNREIDLLWGDFQNHFLSDDIMP